MRQNIELRKLVFIYIEVIVNFNVHFKQNNR